MDVADTALGDVVATAAHEAVVHFAAERPRDRSETDPEAFTRSNVDGTRNLLESAVAAGAGMIVHVSTDEGYGPCEGDPFVEDDKLRERGPRRAPTRAARLSPTPSRVRTSDGPPSPSSGPQLLRPWQHPEKAIPRWIVRPWPAIASPCVGDGAAEVRDWMAVEDACSAIELLVERRAAGDVYNVARRAPRQQTEMARAIARAAGHRTTPSISPRTRPDHDRRYAGDANKLRALGWRQGPTSRPGRETLDWYRANRPWWRPSSPSRIALRGRGERADKT